MSVIFQQVGQEYLVQGTTDWRFDFEAVLGTPPYSRHWSFTIMVCDSVKSEDREQQAKNLLKELVSSIHAASQAF